MKKTFAAILIMSMITSLLSSCGIFKSVSPSEDIVNIQTAGYLYTSSSRAGTKDERQFLDERQKAVEMMMDYIRKGIKNSFDVNSGLDSYEDNLIDYIDKIKDPDNDALETIGNILEKVTAYNVITESYEEELRQYQKMKVKDDASEAIINSFIMDSFYKLIDVQNEYIVWLMEKTAQVSSVLEDKNSRQADKLISSSQSIYSKKIYGSLTELLENHELASFIHSALISADYYISGICLERTLTNIEKSAPGQSLDELKHMYDTALSSHKKPSTLKPIPDIMESLSFVRTVSAETGEKEFSTYKGYLEHYTSDGLPTEDSLPKPSVSGENFTEKIEALPKSIYTPSKDAKTAQQTASDNAALRTVRIALIKAGQTTIKSLNIFRSDKAYSMAVYIISNMVAGGDTMSEDSKQATIDSIKTNLDSLIGESREAFVNQIIISKAEEVYGAFETWRDKIDNLAEYQLTKNDLNNLLGDMGFKTAEITPTETVEPEPTAEQTTPEPSSSTVPNPTPEPDSSQAPVDNDTPDTDNYNVAEITALWQTVKEFNRYLDNAQAMYMLFGWTDLIDYSKYEKKEINNKDGNLFRIQYLDGSSRVGWQTSIYDDYIEYDYRFPDSNDAGITIIRVGTPEKSYISMIKSYNEFIDRKADIRFNDPEDPDKKEIVRSISQSEAGEKDGLNSSAYNSMPNFILFDMGEVLESYVYKDGILVREVNNVKRDGKIESYIKEYYDSGKIRNDYIEFDGKNDGTYIGYYETGIVSRRIEYLEGKFHGEFITYYENSEIYEHYSYKYGLKDGPAMKYQSDDPHILRFEGAYVDDKMSGLWKSYDTFGNLGSETEYVLGVKHGIYRDYRVGNEMHTTSYHAFGQYDNGKRTGQWEFGTDNETPIELVWYEDDVKIWTQYTDTNIRKYYDEAGNVIRQEDMN